MDTKLCFLLEIGPRMYAVTNKSNHCAGSNMRGCSFFGNAHRILFIGNSFANSVSGVGCLLMPIEESGHSEMKACLPEVT